MRAAALLALTLVAACGGGDDGMQMCGADHCGLQGHTIVKWTFDAYPEWQFPMDSCVDFGALKVDVDAVDSLGGVHSAIDDCGAGQVTFDGLPDGMYTMFLAPRDIDGADLVSAPVSATVAAGTYGADTMVTINVPYTSWIGTYTGTFLFRLSWAGQTCASATPPVVMQTVMVTSGGVPVSAMADNGQKLDGTDPKPCYDLMANFPQSATGMPFGPAQLTIDGYSDAGATMKVYSKTFDTFIGAGITNPTITYDVPAAI